MNKQLLTNRPDIATNETLRLFLRATFRYKKLVVLSFFLPISVVLMSVLCPLFASKIIASLVQNSDAMIYLWLFIGTVVLSILCNRVGMRACIKLQSCVMHDLQIQAFSHLLSRSIGFFSNKIGGKLVSDALDFSNAYPALATAGFIKGLGFLCAIVTGLVILLFSSWQLGLFASVFLSFITVWTIAESRKRSGLRYERLKLSKKLTSHISDNLVNAPTVKAFASENKEVDLAEKHGQALRELRTRDWQRATTNEGSRNGAILLMQAGMLALLIILVKDNPHMLASGIFAFTYTLSISGRFFELGTIIRQVEEAFLAASPMATILQGSTEITDSPNASELKVKNSSITLTAVDFKYSDSDEYVFKKLSLNIKSGEKIGLVGKSGGGKSTLTRLLLRFDDIKSGNISIDKQDISKVTQASLRSSIAYVPQEPLLFHRSILENIIYGKANATLDDAIDAAKKAFAFDFIQKLPQGFDTLVGERGVKLSGGQRQRIAIARAILKDAPILILDEATSALDSESEQYIQKSFANLMKNRTSIVVAHRLSTIQKMDRIIVIDDGKITEEGSHDTLIKQNGIYAKLWKHQSGGFIEE